MWSWNHVLSLPYCWMMLLSSMKSARAALRGCTLSHSVRIMIVNTHSIYYVPGSFLGTFHRLPHLYSLQKTIWYELPQLHSSPSQDLFPHIFLQTLLTHDKVTLILFKANHLSSQPHDLQELLSSQSLFSCKSLSTSICFFPFGICSFLPWP